MQPVSLWLSLCGLGALVSDSGAVSALRPDMSGHCWETCLAATNIKYGISYLLQAYLKAGPIRHKSVTVADIEPPETLDPGFVCSGCGAMRGISWRRQRVLTRMMATTLI